MNPSQPTTHPDIEPIDSFEGTDDEPLRIRDYAKATALVVIACASIGFTFTIIGVCMATGDARKRVFNRRRR